MRSSRRLATVAFLTCLCVSLTAQPYYWTSKDDGPVCSREPRNRLIGYVPLYADEGPAHVPRTFYTHPPPPPVVIGDRPMVVRPASYGQAVLYVPYHPHPQTVIITTGQTNVLIQNNVLLPVPVVMPIPTQTPVPVPTVTPTPTPMPTVIPTQTPNLTHITGE